MAKRMIWGVVIGDIEAPFRDKDDGYYHVEAKDVKEAIAMASSTRADDLCGDKFGDVKAVALETILDN